MQKSANIERHKRHILLKEIGGHGQNLIANSHIAIIGAGGLGCPCLLYLAAAGIGKITIIDDDIVDISNLQRQIIFKTNDIGTPKVDCAKREIKALDDNIEIITHQCRINKENAENLLKDADIIIDGCDNFETRFIVNEASFKLKKILISGALGQFEGQIMAFDYRGGNGPCYNCFVPDMPQTQENCNIMGVVGAICGIIGSIMALEALKIIANAGNSLIGRIIIFDGLNAKSRNIAQSENENCKICSKSPS